MRKTIRSLVGSGRARAWGLSTAIALLVPFLVANHWGQAGWRDRHYRYPARPSSYTQIVNRFGQPCNSNARAIRMSWRASDTGQTYSFKFHRKLGGYPTEMVGNKGGRST
ncbi:MAG TPA: hypothetical protein VF129_09775, partial [Actinomycetota bacterium]